MLQAVRENMRQLGRPRNEELAGGVGSLTLYDQYPGVVLLHSNTFMNTSGKSVKEAMKWFRREYQMKRQSEGPLIPKFLVFHDDLDMELGSVRLKQASRASNGHNGLKSVGEVLQEDFVRLRVGIGRPAGSKDARVISDYVLGRFRREEEEILAYESVPKTLDYIDSIIKSGIV